MCKLQVSCKQIVETIGGRYPRYSKSETLRAEKVRERENLCNADCKALNSLLDLRAAIAEDSAWSLVVALFNWSMNDVHH